MFIGRISINLMGSLREHAGANLAGGGTRDVPKMLQYENWLTTEVRYSCVFPVIDRELVSS